MREILDAYFTGDQQAARGYVLDERGALRKHMAIFVDGAPIRDRHSLNDPVGTEGTVDVLQALSGG